jgi:hypothetical protein
MKRLPGYSRHLVRYLPLGLLSMLATVPPLTDQGPVSVLKKSSGPQKVLSSED